MFLPVLLGLAVLAPAAAGQNAEAVKVKEQILELARKFQGQGDADFSRQRQIDPLVRKLLQAAPQPPVKDRLKLLYGPWKQVWGPYDYRNDDRGVDPELGINEIYQVVFEGGYYYNVSPNYPDGDRSKERISLLRGEYKLVDGQPDLLRVKFTKFPGARSRIPGRKLWELAEMAEQDKLPNRITIVPTFIVRLFFGGGTLREVYTDEDLRLIYGSDGKNNSKESLYVMERAR